MSLPLTCCVNFSPKRSWTHQWLQTVSSRRVSYSHACFCVCQWCCWSVSACLYVCMYVRVHGYLKLYPTLHADIVAMHACLLLVDSTPADSLIERKPGIRNIIKNWPLIFVCKFCYNAIFQFGSFFNA